MIGLLKMLFSGYFYIGLGIGAVAVYFLKPLIDVSIAKIIDKND